jgi:hypothetical protein
MSYQPPPLDFNSTACLNATAEPSATQSNTTSVVVSIFLTIIGAAVLAYSMVVQRYGLAHPDQHILLCGCRWHRLLVWLMGTILYGVANGFKVTALNLGPVAVLGSVFSTTLVFNLLFARRLLHEEITTPKVASSLAILVGAVVCTIGAPSTVKTVFTPSDVDALMEGHVGYVVIMSSIMCASLGAVIWFEYMFPMTKEVRALVAAHGPAGAVAGHADADTKPGAAPLRLPSARLNTLMAVVSVAGLGVDETLADLLIRAWTAMLGTCSHATCPRDCNVPILYISILLWVVLAFGGSLIWMPIIYRRIETTVALPIEYGAVNVGAVLTGMLFYDEWQYMETWQIVMQVVGCVAILVGIAVGRIPAKGSEGIGGRMQGVHANEGQPEC